MSDFIKRGKAAAEELAKQTSAGETKQFFLKDGESAKIAFLDGDNTATDPACFYSHTVPQVSRSNKKFFVDVPCNQQAGQRCYLCEIGNKKNKRFVWTILHFLDKEQQYERTVPNSEMKYTVKEEVKLFAQGRRVHATLEILQQKVKLQGRLWDVTRSGKGSDTLYNFIALPGTEGDIKQDEIPK
jgi:hypothetical protein